MNKIKKCIPLCLRDISQVERLVRENKERADFFEIWCDYLEGDYFDTLLRLIKEYPDRLLILSRRKNLEKIKTPISDRFTRIEKLGDLKVYFDFDIKAQQKELKYFRKSKCKAKLITSYHNYRKTPKSLFKVFNSMLFYKPTIVKFACLTESPADSLRLINFLNAIKDKKDYKSVVLGMGKAGLILRVFGEELGNYMTFVAPEAEGNNTLTAPNQLTISELEAFESLINKVRGDDK